MARVGYCALLLLEEGGGLSVQAHSGDMADSPVAFRKDTAIPGGKRTCTVKAYRRAQEEQAKGQTEAQGPCFADGALSPCPIPLPYRLPC